MKVCQCKKSKLCRDKKDAVCFVNGLLAKQGECSRMNARFLQGSREYYGEFAGYGVSGTAYSQNFQRSLARDISIVRLHGVSRLLSRHNGLAQKRHSGWRTFHIRKFLGSLR